MPAIFSGKPNMGGGGIAATIGNAHVVEDMDDLALDHRRQHARRRAERRLHRFADRTSTATGYNLFGDVDFSPDARAGAGVDVPEPAALAEGRRRDGVAVGDVLDLGNVGATTPSTRSGRTRAPAVLWYPPRGVALDRIPADDYSVPSVSAGYDLVDYENPVDDFPSLVLDKIKADFGFDLRSENPGMFDDLSAVVWYPEGYTWPSDPRNAPWISFWRNVDAAIGDRLGTVGLGDEFWGSFAEGPFGDHLWMSVYASDYGPTPRSGADQLGNARFAVSWGDVGAVEIAAETVRTHRLDPDQ